MRWRRCSQRCVVESHPDVDSPLLPKHSHLVSMDQYISSSSSHLIARVGCSRCIVTLLLPTRCTTTSCGRVLACFWIFCGGGWCEEKVMFVDVSVFAATHACSLDGSRMVGWLPGIAPFFSFSFSSLLSSTPHHTHIQTSIVFMFFLHVFFLSLNLLIFTLLFFGSRTHWRWLEVSLVLVLGQLADLRSVCYLARANSMFVAHTFLSSTFACIPSRTQNLPPLLQSPTFLTTTTLSATRASQCNPYTKTPPSTS